jgi:hypothetical protein
MPNDNLSQLFDFLKSNRSFNKEVQHSFYKHVISPYKSPNDRAISLLHHVANTQSQPNIDKLAVFYKLIQDNYCELSNFSGFLSVLNVNKTTINLTYSDVFNKLHELSGWGKKTAALFVKSIYHLHNGDYDHDLQIWNDAPRIINCDEPFYLPADAVIQFIFEALKVNCKYDFDGINNYLHKSNLYPGNIMEIWDDLWFWGFITQKGGGDKRKIEWNENKYWSLLHTNKTQKQIGQIKRKAGEFIDIIR